nr:hypothetical protein [Tanacetum cinerariifolium]
MIAILKQFQATPPPASIKAIEEIYVTCGGAHPYYQCLAANGNTFLELRDNIQGYVAAAAVNYNQAITTRSGIVLDGPSVPIPPPFINPKEDERVEETLTDQDLAECTIKVPPPLVQKPKPPSQRNFVVHQRDPLHPNIPYPSRMLKQKQQEKDEKMLKAFLSNKGKLIELANTPHNENFSAVILKKLPEKLGDPRKFLIPCGFSEFKCKALADLGASINLMPLSVWKKLGLPKLISTRMTRELANRAICPPAGIARDVFVPVGKFTFPADFVIVDYESDPRVPFILGRPFLRTARALIDVHGEEMILRDELFTTTHQSGNPTFSSHPKLTSPEVKDDVFDPDQVLKPLFPSLIPVEDINSFLEKFDTSLSYSDISLPEFEILSIIRKRRIVAVLLLMLITLFPNFYFDIEEKNSDSTIIHADISLLDLECFKFEFKPDPGELTSIVDSEIYENVLSATNVNLPPEEDHSPLFAYDV